MIVYLADSERVTYWKQERLIFSIQEHDSIKMWSNLKGSQSSPIATYLPDNDYVVLVDLTDYVRANPNVSHLYFYSEENDETYDVTLTIAGLINPAGVYIPPFTMPDALIVPPEHILYAGITDIRSEFYPTVITGLTWELEGSATFAANKRWITAIDDFYILRVKTGENTIKHNSTFQLVEVDACKSPVVAVRWVSFTGVQRVHHFMLRKPTIASAENYQLMTPDNYYEEIKGRVDGFDLYLDNLLLYDLWYYADVITSSKVEVSLDGQTWNKVQVTNKNVTIPTWETGDGKLEITVNWKRYDAVAM